MSRPRIALLVSGAALLAAALVWIAPRLISFAVPAAREGAEAPCACEAGETAPEAPAASSEETTDAQPPPPGVEVARHAVCEREEAPARLALVALVAGRSELVALHCGRSLHLIAVEALGDALVPQRVASVLVNSPSPAETPIAVEPSAADVNGDGRPDLIAPVLLVDGAGTPRGGALYLLRQAAEGGLEAPVQLLSAAPSAVQALTLDAEAGQDLAVLQQHDASTARPDEVWLVQGGRAPLRVAQRLAGVGTGGLAALDLDLDGKDDLAAAGASDARLRLWLSSRGPLAQVDALEIALPGVQHALAADLDTDGARELVLSGDQIWLLRPRADALFEPAAIGGSQGLRDLHVADADGDGKPDLVGYAHPELFVLASGPGGVFERKLLAALRGDAAVLFARAAQLDRDARPDLVMALLSDDGRNVELAIARNVDLGVTLRLSGTSAPIADAALRERFTAM